MEHEYGAFESNRKMKKLIDKCTIPLSDWGTIEEGEYPVLFINQPGRLLALDLSKTEVFLGTEKLTDILDSITELGGLGE